MTVNALFEYNIIADRYIIFFAVLVINLALNIGVFDLVLINGFRRIGNNLKRRLIRNIGDYICIKRGVQTIVALQIFKLLSTVFTCLAVLKESITDDEVSCCANALTRIEHSIFTNKNRSFLTCVRCVNIAADKQYRIVFTVYGNAGIIADTRTR